MASWASFILTQGLQLIELWETFLLQLDAGEDGVPYYVPSTEGVAGETAALESPAPNNETSLGAEDNA